MEIENTDETLKPYIPGPEAKFKTVEDLAKAKAESDAFIERIKEENADIRRQLGEYEANLQKAKGIDEVLAALKNMNETERNNNVSDDDRPRFEDSGERNHSRTPGTDETHVRQLIERTISELNQKSSAEQNWQEVNNKFLEKHNGDSEEALVAMKYAAKELDMTLDEFRQFAASKPQAALRATGILQASSRNNEPTRFAGKGSTSGGTSGEAASSGPKPKSYYDSLKAQLKQRGQLSKFYSPEIQNQIHKDAGALGDAWFNS